MNCERCGLPLTTIVMGCDHHPQPTFCRRCGTEFRFDDGQPHAFCLDCAEVAAIEVLSQTVTA